MRGFDEGCGLLFPDKKLCRHGNFPFHYFSLFVAGVQSLEFPILNQWTDSIQLFIITYHKFACK